MMKFQVLLFASLAQLALSQPDACTLPEIDCFAIRGYAYRYNRETNTCEYDSFCSDGPFNHPTKELCEKACVKQQADPCNPPSEQCFRYQGDTYRYDVAANACKKVAYCIEGPFNFATQAACQNTCVKGKSSVGIPAKHSKGKKTTTPLPDVTTPQVSAVDRCFQCRSRRNQKDLYPDENECHHFYQCFYFNETYALGYRRRCPDGQFWHDAVLSCMPEGDVPCVDRCLDDAIAARGWYAGTGCRQYFFCSNTGSNGMCCPTGTEFNLATGACDLSESCADDCVPVAPAIPTTVAPAELFNSTVCQDSFGTYIYFDGSESNAYWLIDAEGQATEKQYCPGQVSFEFSTCRCNLDSDAEAPAPTPKQMLLFFDPFNPTVDDVSVHKFKVFLYDGAFQDWAITINPGRASLNVNGGHAEVPGLQSQNYQSHISLGGHFRCAAITTCQTGAIMSNNKDAAQSEYSFIVYVQAPNTLVVKFNFWAPVGAITLQGNFITPTDSWNKFAATYDGNTARLYINGAQADSQNIGGYLAVAHCPLSIGNDQSIGTFVGNLDSISIAKWTYNFTDQLAIANDDGQYMVDNGWVEPWWNGGAKL